MQKIAFQVILPFYFVYINFIFLMFVSIDVGANDKLGAIVAARTAAEIRMNDRILQLIAIKNMSELKLIHIVEQLSQPILKKLTTAHRLRIQSAEYDDHYKMAVVKVHSLLNTSTANSLMQKYPNIQWLDLVISSDAFGTFIDQSSFISGKSSIQSELMSAIHRVQKGAHLKITRRIQAILDENSFILSESQKILLVIEIFQAEICAYDYNTASISLRFDLAKLTNIINVRNIQHDFITITVSENDLNDPYCWYDKFKFCEKKKI